jgi:hypothetical protein
MPGDEETMSDEAIWETLPVCLNFIFTFFSFGILVFYKYLSHSCALQCAPNLWLLPLIITTSLHSCCSYIEPNNSLLKLLVEFIPSDMIL